MTGTDVIHAEKRVTDGSPGATTKTSSPTAVATGRTFVGVGWWIWCWERSEGWRENYERHGKSLSGKTLARFVQLSLHRFPIP
jgi:hypothetical protein